jgi:hypothetical protein
MAISPLAGKPAPRDLLVDLSRLEHEHHAQAGQGEIGIELAGASRVEKSQTQ